MSEHLSAQDMERYRQRTLSPAELLTADDHLAACPACRERLREAEEPHTAFASLRADLRSEARAEPDHPPYERLAGYVDDALDPIDREILSSHLDLCPRCTAEVRDLRAFRAMMTTYPVKEYAPAKAPALWQRSPGFWSRPARWAPLSAVGVAAAALVVFWTAARPLQNELADRRAQVDALEQANTALEKSNDALQRQVAAAGELETRVTQLQREKERIQAERRRIQAENERLRQRQAKAQPPAPQPGPKTPGVPLALSDGGAQLLRDRQGNLIRVERQPLPRAVQVALEDRRLRTPAAIASLIGKQDVLMGGPDKEAPFTVQAPAGTAVPTDRPTFSWRPLEGATGYTVAVFDAGGNEVAKSEVVSGTTWTVQRPLPRGRVYQWEVYAHKGGQEIDKAPKPPAPDARFKVLDAAKAAELERARQTYADSPLTLGVLYAEAGLLDDAERELTALLKANPQSDIARKLHESLQDLRRGKP